MYYKHFNIYFLTTIYINSIGQQGFLKRRAYNVCFVCPHENVCYKMDKTLTLCNVFICQNYSISRNWGLFEYTKLCAKLFLIVYPVLR